MLEIKVKNQTIEDILLKNSNVIDFSTRDIITENMRIKFYCDGRCGRTYVEGVIRQIYSQQKNLDDTGSEYSCEINADLILF